MPTHEVRGVLLENPGSFETRTALTAAMLADRSDAPVSVLRCATQDLEALAAGAPTASADGGLAQRLRAGLVLPVGSVGFLRAAMRVAGAPEPPNMSYPMVLRRHLHRCVQQRAALEVSGRCFVKPVSTKAFTGFVFDETKACSDYPEDVQADLAAFELLRQQDPTSAVWTSEPVSFQCEWRYYIQGGRILGAARYDLDGAEGAPPPERRVVEEAVAEMARAGVDHSFALDFGVLAEPAPARTALIEANDAWAIGLYGRALTPAQFLGFLWERWLSIRDVALS